MSGLHGCSGGDGISWCLTGLKSTRALLPGSGTGRLRPLSDKGMDAMEIISAMMMEIVPTLDKVGRDAPRRRLGQSDRGLWRDPRPVPPWEFRRH